MSNYIINRTDPLHDDFIIRPYTSNGPKFPTTSALNDSSVTASSCLLLYGKGHPNYGERTDENLLHLLENFSGASEPVIKIPGMLWHKEVLYYNDIAGPTFYVYDGTGSPAGWNPVPLSVTVGLEPASKSDGDYWFDNTGSPNILYQYSSSSATGSINQWIPRLYAEGTGFPTIVPTKELQIYDGSAWDVLPDLTAVTALLTATVGAYLLLDTSNGPLTGDLAISKATPTLSLVGANATVQLGATGSPLEWEVANGGALQAKYAGTSLVEVSTGGILSVTLASYETAIAANNDIPNKKYVDDLFSGAIVGDTFVNAGSFGILGSPSSGTITLNYSTTGSPGPLGSLYITGVDSNNIPFVGGLVGGTEPASTVDAALLAAAPYNNPTFTGDVTVPNLTGTSPLTNAANKAYVDAAVSAAVSSTATAAQRWIATSLDSEFLLGLATTFTLPFSYQAGTNRLMVFKNGVKLYHDNIAYDDAIFSSALESAGATAGLTLLTISGVVTGASGVWIVDGDHTADIETGNNFQIQGDTGGGSPDPNAYYTAASVVYDSSPGQTRITVTGTIPATAVGDGQLGLDYVFNLNLDGIGSPDVHEVGPVNAFDAQTFGNLVSAMQTAIDTTFGANTATVYLIGTNIRVQSQQLPGIGVAYSNLVGSPPTRDLFASNNLGDAGFQSFLRGGTPVAGATYGYYESDGVFDLSPLVGGGLAAPGSTANVVTLNDSLSGSDVLEFILT